MKMRKILFVCGMIVIIAFFQCSQSEKSKLVEFVDPLIGTTNGGNQNPGPLAPFGMIHPGAINNGRNEPLATNYIFGNEVMYGFSLTNLVGVGCANYGSIVVMPTIAEMDFDGYQSKYSQECAEVAYYSVILDDYMIKSELTAAQRSAILRFHFPAGKANLLIDLSRRKPEDKSFMIRKVSATEIEGYKSDGRFCADGDKIHHTIYFFARVNLVSEQTGLVVDNVTREQSVKEARGEDIGAYISYDFREKTVVELRVGVSYVSIENARLNLEAETGNKEFETVRSETADRWEKLLSRIAVEGGTHADRIMFYTALYHTMSHPNLLNDVNGEYPAMGSYETVRVENGDSRYTVFSLWDTYRTLHPFFTLVYPDIQDQMARSMMDMYRENGWLPQWELISRETHVMLGDPASIVMADSYLKGIQFDDPDLIYEAMVNNAENHYIMKQWGYDDVAHIRRGVVPYLKYDGWIPHNYKAGSHKIWATVSTTQEYNLADWNIAQMAKALNKDAEAEKFEKRAKGYRNLYNPETMFFQSRWADGRWLEPFDPLSRYDEMPWKYSGGPGYCEGNAWNYNFFVPHDIPGLIELMGGEEAFINRLQTLFDGDHYDPGNEPDIAFPFLFNYVKGEEWRTQKIVRNLITKHFGTGVDGIPGNDDTGTMSAWLLFAMMGIYPDCPGNLDYQICSPVFKKVTLTLNQDYYPGEELIIRTSVNNVNGVYINSMEFNGEPLGIFKVNHNDLVEGGELIIKLKGEK